MGTEIKVLSHHDLRSLDNVADIFDDPIQSARAKEFLQDARHHLIIALESETVIGFVSAVHYVHPDKAHPELWINEVGVAATHQRQGIGKAMMQKACEVGRELGCKEAWVLTERSNTAAMKLYGSSGGTESEAILFTFDLSNEKTHE
jgi:ribosomal protein S18 acetylase RimI-like enzyme